MTLTFPSISDVLMGEDGKQEPEQSPEELLAKQMEEMKAKEKKQYLNFFKTSNTRFCLPSDDYTFFDELFVALDDADSSHVTIVHYGDSQIEGDRMTSTIREEFQEKFGGMGPGILPLLQKVGRLCTGQTTSTVMPCGRAYGSEKGRNNKYGPMASVTYLDGNVTMSVCPYFSNKRDTMHCQSFSRLTVYAENTSAPLVVTCMGDTKTLPPSEGMKSVTFAFRDSVMKAKVSMSGHATVYGLVFGSEYGVQMDNVPMRGCSGTMFTSINPTQLKEYYKQENVRLILFQYGGNAVPYLHGTKGISAFTKNIKKQIRCLQALSSKAKIVMIGPSDMSTRIKGEWQTYPILPEFSDSLRIATNEVGAAYWDLYQVMGGYNSMAQWCRQSPPLAGGDHIHFSNKGARQVAELFWKSLQMYYDYYKLKKDSKNYHSKK